MRNPIKNVVESAIEYYAFVLGYDLMQKYLAKRNLPCEEAHLFCKSVYANFLISGYDDKTISEYDALRNYVTDRYLRHEEE